MADFALGRSPPMAALTEVAMLAARASDRAAAAAQGKRAIQLLLARLLSG